MLTCAQSQVLAFFTDALVGSQSPVPREGIPMVAPKETQGITQSGQRSQDGEVVGSRSRRSEQSLAPFQPRAWPAADLLTTVAHINDTSTPTLSRHSTVCEIRRLFWGGERLLVSLINRTIQMKETQSWKGKLA